MGREVGWQLNFIVRKLIIKTNEVKDLNSLNFRFENLINRCDIFVLIWFLYMMKDSWYESGIINNVLQALMICWCTIGIYNYIRKNYINSSIIRAVLLLVLMYIVYGLDFILFSYFKMNVPSYYYLQISLNSLLPIIQFYIYARDGYLSVDKIKRYILLFMIMAFANYFYIRSTYTNEELTNNAGYSFVSIIPIVILYKKHTLFKYIMLSIIMLYVILAMKRGAIMIGALCVLIFIYSQFKKSNWKIKGLSIIFTAFLVYGAVSYVEHMMNTSDYFMHRIQDTEDGNSSGRNIIYTKIINEFELDDNVFHFLFGHGANHTVQVAGNFAHQDWLETLCDNGIVGVIILLNVYWILWRNYWRYSKIGDTHMKYVYLAALTICTLKTMFSMSIQNLEFMQSIILGYFAYDCEQHNIGIKWKQKRI